MTSLDNEDIFSSHRDTDVNVSLITGVLFYVSWGERDVHAPNRERKRSFQSNNKQWALPKAEK